jgi:hypothetical protein
MEAGRRSKDAARRVVEDAVKTTSRQARETTRVGIFVLMKVAGWELNCAAPQKGITPWMQAMKWFVIIWHGLADRHWNHFFCGH